MKTLVQLYETENMNTSPFFRAFEDTNLDEVVDIEDKETKPDEKEDV